MSHILRMLLLAILFTALTPVMATSLWNDSAKNRYKDAKARAVGDLLTVIIVQQSSSATEAKHVTDKSLNVNGSGGSGWFSGFTGLGVKTDRSTNGNGAASSSTSLADQLTVRVTEVLPNGNLKIEGTRNIRLEKDEMTLIFSGLVRQDDIAPDNSVISTAVADQRLEAKGTGPIAEKQRPGILSRLLSLLW